MDKLEKKQYEIQKDTYDWCVKKFKTVEDNFGLKVHVHADDGTLQNGEIFLFNHFARFETAIPPYIIYKETGLYSRTIADKELFSASEKLTNFLTGGGAVPNNMPGLLPFLAAEILRGRKVVIFPEGGMVKDRRVMDEKGKYGIFSRTANQFRKHHRGAAILALTLDLFKRRIKDLHENGDTKRLEHWRDALELESIDLLLERANKATLIVPGTITFYPIRIDENIAGRIADFFVKNLPSQAMEEIIVEGNMFLKDTDMDIRFGEMIDISKSWHWWERMLLNKYFLSIKSLDELFSLRHEADSFSEKILAGYIAKETDRIRDMYMGKIYEGTTVNFAHIASTLIMHLLKKDIFTLPKYEFHEMIYLTIKKIQADPKIHLHKSFLDPSAYKDLPFGKSPGLKQFMRNAKVARLIKEGKKSYYFREKILDDHDYHMVRLENPIRVRANEAEPITKLQDIIQDTIKTYNKVKRSDVGAYMFDDEIREVAFNKQLYVGAQYNKIHELETIKDSTDPYLLLQKKKAKVGVLLVHGFLSSPGELKALGKKLHAEGYSVLGMRVAGHGTSPWDLNNRTYDEWQSSVYRNYKIIEAYCDKVVVVGFSGGGALSLNFAATNPESLAGVASVCTPLILKDKMMHLVPLLHYFNKFVALLPKMESLVPFKGNRSDYPATNYASMPVQALNELRYLVQKVKKNLKYVTCKVFVLQSTDDPVVNPKAAQIIYNLLTSKDKEVHMIESNRHGIIYDDVGETHNLLIEFIRDASKQPKK